MAINLGWVPHYCLKIARQFTLIRNFCMIKAYSHKLMTTVFVFWLFFIFSIAMYEDNKYVDGLRISTAVELYLNSAFCSKHPSCISLISKHPKVFSSTDTILTISVSQCCW